MDFIGRDRELNILKGLKSKKKSSLAVIKGRRRIGKSRLAEEFAKNYKFISLTGFPPTKNTTAESQRKHFALQLEKYFHYPLRYDNWYELLVFLAEQTNKDNLVILFDEISWMGSKDPEFLGTLKTVWDQQFSKNPNLLMLLCGSISSWIDKNILSNTGFLGRISTVLELKELSLPECSGFWGRNKNNISAQEKFKLFSVTGGVPRYLEEIDPKVSSAENIRRLCFTPSGILYNGTVVR